MPVLLIVGEKDQKFLQIGHEMKSHIGTNAELVVIENAGHSVHLEQTKDFQMAVDKFLN
jgi:pimeloyl-ACP methyl ester carboxylesterase